MLNNFGSVTQSTRQFNKPTNYGNVYSSARMRMCDLVSTRALFEQKRNTPQLINQWNDKLVRSDFFLELDLLRVAFEEEIAAQ